MDSITQDFARHRKMEHKLFSECVSATAVIDHFFSKKEILKLKMAYIKLA